MALSLTGVGGEGGASGGGPGSSTNILKRRKEIFVVHTAKRENDVLPGEWRKATRVSLIGIKQFPVLEGMPQCGNMSTLLVFKSHNLERLPEALFRLVPNLRVLQLSLTDIKELPPSIGLLVNLRVLNLYCTKIKELPPSIGLLVNLRILNLSKTYIKELPPSIGLLVNLQYLGLRGTCVTSLPREVGNLVRLHQLDLEVAWSLQDIPREAILKLTNLQVLNLLYSRVRFGRNVATDAHGGDRGGQLEVTDLEGLTQLSELGITVTTLSSLQELASSSALSRCTAFLHLWKKVSATEVWPATEVSAALHKLGQRLQRLFLEDDETDPMAGELQLHGDEFPSLETLEVWGLYSANLVVVQGGRGSLFQSLMHLEINNVNGLRELNWAGKLPSLEVISVRACPGLVEILATDDGQKDDQGYFPQLHQLALLDLPSLKSISSHPLLFPSLVRIHVRACPGLRKLPFSGTHSAKKLRVIEGEEEWWDGLEWDDGGIKAAFAPYFQEEDD